MDKLADAVNDLIINDAEYHVSKSVTENDAKGNPARDPKTVNHTSDGKEKVRYTSNRKPQKIMSNRTLPVVIPKMNPSIENRIAPIGRAYQTPLMPVMKEVVVDAACGGAWINRTPGQIN